jgi:hypothetical protein
MTDIGLRRAKQGDDSGRLAAARTLRKFRTWVADEPEMISLLVSHGETSRAARFVAEAWEDMSEGYWVARFSASTGENLPAFLQNFEDNPGLRHYAEQLVALAPDQTDAKGDPLAGFPPHAERVVDLARRFSEIEFDDFTLRRKSLARLLNQEGSRQALAPVVAEEWQRIHWPGVGHARNDDALWIASLMAHRLQGLGEQADSGAATFSEIFAGLEQARPGTIFPEYELESWALSMVLGRVMSQLEQMPGEQVLNFLPSFNSWLAQALTYRNFELETAVGAQVLMSWLAGEAGGRQLAEWRDNLDDDLASRWLSGYHDLDEVFLPAQYAINGWEGYFDGPKPVDIRLARERLLCAQRLIEGMLGDPWIASVSKDEIEDSGIYSIIENMGVAAMSEMLPHADALVAASSRGAFRTWLELSRIASGRQELELLDRAIDAALNDEDRIEAKTWKIFALIEARQKTTAVKLFDEIRKPLTKQAEEEGNEKLGETVEEIRDLLGE